MTRHCDDFFRLATGLRAAVIDYDYHKTRKLLEPNWDGYNMPKNHDLIHTDVDLVDANLLTSQHRDNPDLHRVVLDLDYGVVHQHALDGGPQLSLHKHAVIGRWSQVPVDRIAKVLPPDQARTLHGRGSLHIEPLCDFVLIPSSTGGHHHLILDVNLTWEKYHRLLRLFADCGIIEAGYVKASAQRGFSAIRPPWVRKRHAPALTSTNTKPV